LITVAVFLLLLRLISFQTNDFDCGIHVICNIRATLPQLLLPNKRRNDVDLTSVVGVKSINSIEHRQQIIRDLSGGETREEKSDSAETHS
jgi:hypothetical protein